MSRLEKSVIAVVLVLALLAVADFALYRGSSRVSNTLRTVRDVAQEQYDRLSGQQRTPAAPAPPPAVTAVEPRRPAPTPRQAAPAAEVPLATPAATVPTPAAPAPVIAVLSPAPVAPTATRGDFYLTGRASSWTTYDIPIVSPTLIRAAGRITAGTDAAGPDGLETSSFERSLAQRRQTQDADQRVLSTAPYLAMVGRVCSVQACSEPFIIGSRTVLCPSDLKVAGNLQVWTNNYLRVDGTQTTLTFSNVTGGYSFYTEPAAPAACATGAARVAAPAPSVDAGALAAGRTLRNPEFVITSSQSSWKPFFLPLGEPLLIRASGSMQPRGGVDATDPRGIAVPAGARWAYPGTGDLVVDADHRLYDPSVPYQALIGRLCGRTGCGSAFLVGTERVICPTPQLGDRMELWINHIIRPASLLSQLTPLSLDALDLQQRRGAYHFEVSRAPASACAG